MNLKILVILVLAILSDVGVSQDAVRIERIRVIDAEFNEVATVQEPAALTSLGVLWRKMAPVDCVESVTWTHKLDIVSDDLGGRWLYSSNGYIARLNKQLSPRYRIIDHEAFNRLLGI